MAATNVQSGNGGLNSPNSQRVVSSPWNPIVTGGGGGSEVISPVMMATVGSAPASPSCSSVQEHVDNSSPVWSPSKVVQEPVSPPDDSGTEGQPDGSSNASKKPVWNRPSNGVVEVVSPVMGAAWPALGESTKASLKSSSSESLKALSDGSLPPALQVVTGNSSPSHKHASANNPNSISPPNHVAPARQRSMKRGGGNSTANVSANGVVSQPPPTSHDSVVETPHNTSGKQSTASEQPSPRDNTHKESQKGGFGSQSHSGNDHHHQRGSFRRGNGGQHPRGDGSYHHNYGGKRDHDRGNQEWNQHSRSFNNRDSHMQSPRGFSRGFIRSPVHTSTPFIAPQMPVTVQPFGNSMMYPDPASPVVYVPYPPPESLRGMPFVAPLPPSIYFAVPDPQLHEKIVTQIEYYFSNENLVKDTYLRKNMDEQGWVPASLIAGFKKVSFLTDNVQLILDAMRTSTDVEVQGDKLRKRNEWIKWIMPAPAQYSNPSSPQASGRSPNYDGLVSHLQGVSFHEPNSEQMTGHLRQKSGGGVEEVSSSHHATMA